MILGFSHQEVGILILFVTGMLTGFWFGFLLGLRVCPPVPLPPGASSQDKRKVFIKLDYEVFDG